MRALGLRHALSTKAKAGAIVVLDAAKSNDDQDEGAGQTASASSASKARSIVDGEFDKNFQLSARNLSHVALLPAAGLNVYDILRRDKLVLTTAAVKLIEERLA